MNSPLESPPWAPRKWVSTIALVFLIQIILLVVLSRKPPRPGQPPQFHTAINLTLDRVSEKQLGEMTELNDPTLFALPNSRGFSGAAWLNFPPPDHHFNDWTQADDWLELDQSSLGKTLLTFLNSNLPAPLLMADKPLPFSTVRLSRPTSGRLVTASEVRLEGALAQRSLLHPISPPSWTHSDILTNTIVQCLVDADGDTQSVTLVSSCGVSEADQVALRLATNARFHSLRSLGEQPKQRNETTWGRMVFHWHTLAPQESAPASVPPL